MSRSMIPAAVTMNQLQNKLDVTSDNMANSQTSGYKSRDAQFASLLYQQINNNTDPENAEGRLTPDGVRVGSGAKLGSVNIDLTPGAVEETDRGLDTALQEKNHLFQIQVEENGEQETRYTRDGAFYLSATNAEESLMLTTENGDPVLGEDGPITFANDVDDVQIGDDGQVIVTHGDSEEVAGSLDIVEAVRPRTLEATGENEYRLPDLDGLGYTADEIIQQTPAGAEKLQASALEQSNVDISKQMTDMLEAQQSYQFNARSISTGDEMQGLINQLR